MKREKVTQDLPMLEWLMEYLEGHNGFIAGGCFKNIFREEKIKDIDIFFYNETEFNKGVQAFNLNAFKYSKVYENEKAIGYHDKVRNIDVDLIRKTYGTPQDIVNKFDFTITKFAVHKIVKEVDIGEIFDSKPTEYELEAIYHDEFFKHLQLRVLKIDGHILFPVSTFERMIRYTQYGYFTAKDCKQAIIYSLRDDTRPLDDLSNVRDKRGSGNDLDDTEENHDEF